MVDFTSHEAAAHKAQSLPISLPGKIIGRDATLAQIYGQLKANKPVLIYGSAGIGKTALAATLASAYTELPGGAVWFNVDDTSLEQFIVRVGRAYNVAEITGSQNPMGMVGAAANTLTSQKPLIVLDGKHNLDATTQFITRCADGLPVLLLSKDKLDGGWNGMELGKLEAAPATALLKQSAGLEGQEGIDDDLDELVSILDYNPFAIMIAAGTLKASKQSPADYLTVFEKIPSSSGVTPELLALTIGFRSLNNALQGIIMMMGATFGVGASSELLSLIAGAPQETIEQVMTMLAQNHFVERLQRYESPFYHLHDITASFATTLLRSKGQLDMLQSKARDAVLTYVKKYAVNSPAAHDKLATEMDMFMAVARWSADQGERDAVNQIIVNLMQAGDFINERGYVYELVKLRQMASSFTSAFPAYPPPPPEESVPEPDVEDELDDLDEEDESEEEDDMEAVPAGSAPSLLELDEEADEEEDEEEDSTDVEAAAAPAPGDLAGLQAALRQAKQQNDTAKQVELLRQIGELEAKAEMDNEAINTYTEALAAYEKLDEPDNILETLDILSALMVKTDNSSAAVLHATRAIGIADDLDDLDSKMHILVTLGDARQQLGESDEAVQAYGRALEIARNEGDSQNEALILYKFGYAQLDSGQADVAAETWEQSLKLFKAQGKRDYEGRVLGALGTAYGELNRWTEAIKFHTSALYIAREVKDKEAEALELGNLGYASVQAKQLGEAVLRYRQALHLAYQANDRDNIISNIVDLSRLLSESPRHLDIADMLVNEAIKLDPTDRDVLKLKERVTSGKMQAYADDVNMLAVGGTAKDYAANAYKLLEA
jgi:tetratricopeptide (TPR) repeat protein/energy-coupling factor transporter ATP-binding protein EcfA2